MELPKFMVDSSEKDGQAETVMDYVLSWCLRMAQANCCVEKPILYRRCRFMLGKLLDIDNLDCVEFLSVRTWKQDDKIDLWVEVDTPLKKYAILIENKYYSQFHKTKDVDGVYRNQLEVYKRKFDSYYSEQEVKRDLHYVVFTCIARSDNKFHKYYDEALLYGYKVFSFYDLLEDHTFTESDIYNEFWLRW